MEKFAQTNTNKVFYKRRGKRCCGAFCGINMNRTIFLNNSMDNVSLTIILLICKIFCRTVIPSNRIYGYSKMRWQSVRTQD